MYTHSSQYRDAGWAEEVKNMGQYQMPHAKEIFAHAILGTYAIVLSVLI